MDTKQPKQQKHVDQTEGTEHSSRSRAGDGMPKAEAQLQPCWFFGLTGEAIPALISIEYLLHLRHVLLV